MVVGDKVKYEFSQRRQSVATTYFPPHQKPLSSPRVWWLGFPQEPKPFCLRHKYPCSCTLVIKHKQMQQSAASPKKRRKVENFLTRSVRWLSFAKGLGKTSRTAKQCSYPTRLPASSDRWDYEWMRRVKLTAGIMTYFECLLKLFTTYYMSYIVSFVVPRGKGHLYRCITRQA